MADYLDSGFDNFLLRPLEAGYTESVGIDATSSVGQISGSQVQGDKINSLNGTLSIDLENDRFILSDGSVNRVEFGRLSDGNIGMVIRDDKGNELMQISGENNIIRSSNQHVELDFNEERILIRDEDGLARILIGKGTF